MQDRPFLILTQSGRFLAEKLQYTGYPVWVADYFADSDTLLACSRWQSLPNVTTISKTALLSVLNQLSQAENCYLICGSGVESIYPYLKDLPDNIVLIGNSSKTIAQVKIPKRFFDLLQQLKINHPQTLFSPPEDRRNWLVKSANGLGGGHIHFLAHSDFSNDDYFQYYQPGISGSGLFIANGEQARLLSLNRHYYQTSEDQAFRLAAIDNSLILSTQHQHQLYAAISKLTNSCHLIGINSIDFIIDQNEQLLVTEINPRPTASAELLPESMNAAKLHIDACRGQLSKETVLDKPDYKASLIYHYASQDLIILPTVNWPAHCHDLPPSNTRIKSQQIVCSSVIKHCHYDQQLHQSIGKTIFSQFNGT